MKTATQNTYGSAKAIHIVEVERSSIGDQDVLVQVFSSLVTQGDRRLRSGDFPGITFLPGRLAMGPFRPYKRFPGTMFAGRVVAVGKAVTRHRVGDDVFGSAMSGAYAEYLAMAQDGPISRMPANLDYAEAAALPYGALTALTFLRDFAKVQSSESVLVLGASGGVGRFAVQIAKHLGAEVTAVCSARNHELVRSLGADYTIDYRTEDFRDNGKHYDVVFDMIGAVRFDEVRASLSASGRFLSLITTARMLWAMFTTWMTGGQRAMVGVALPNQAGLDDVRQLAEQGAIRPVLGRSFELERIQEAHAHLEAGGTRGSVVVTVHHGFDIAAK
jgi:NADPH:quinone reductase-like Zn-dependent oxidoreductase